MVSHALIERSTHRAHSFLVNLKNVRWLACATSAGLRAMLHQSRAERRAPTVLFEACASLARDTAVLAILASWYIVDNTGAAVRLHPRALREGGVVVRAGAVGGSHLRALAPFQVLKRDERFARGAAAGCAAAARVQLQGCLARRTTRHLGDHLLLRRITEVRLQARARGGGGAGGLWKTVLRVAAALVVEVQSEPLVQLAASPLRSLEGLLDRHPSTERELRVVSHRAQRLLFARTARAWRWRGDDRHETTVARRAAPRAHCRLNACADVRAT